MGSQTIAAAMGVTLAMAALACGGSGSSTDTNACATDCPSTTDGTGVADDGVDDGVDAGVDDASVGTTSGSADTGSDSTGAGGVQIPCSVQTVLSDHCWMCHGESPKFGAPMALASPDDFEVPSVSDLTVPVHEQVVDRITDAIQPMPASGQIPVPARALLQTWIAGGRPLDPAEDCDPGDETGGVEPPIEPPCDDPQVFKAHAPGGSDGFAVPQVDDLYACFVLASPFSALEQGIAWAPVIDDERVVHHMLLLTDDAPGLSPGDVFPNCAPLTLSTNMLMGWGPGSGVYEMPPEAGLELPDPSDALILQIHYNNSAGYADAVDGSGFAVCTTQEPRPNVASTLWLGTTDINVAAGSTGTASGDCDTSGIAEPFTMIMSWPHMHQLGRKFVTDIQRIGGAIDPVVDVQAYSFNSQIYYPLEPSIVVQPGDVLRTTCTYDNPTGAPVGFGEGTDAEMCFNFATVYPIGLFDGQGRKCLTGGLGG